MKSKIYLWAGNSHDTSYMWFITKSSDMSEIHTVVCAQVRETEQMRINLGSFTEDSILPNYLCVAHI